LSPTLIDLSPFILYSALALGDSILLGPKAASPWPLLVLIPAALDMKGRGGASSLFAAALPASCAFLDAAGVFSGQRRLASLFPLALALVAAAFARAAGRERQATIVRAAAEHVERERALSSKRDAEVEIAARIQRSLLIDSPEACQGLGLEAITVASASVDGDFYAFIPYTAASTDVLIGDVMGKGVPAALLGAALKGSFLRASLRLMVARPDAPPRPDALVAAVHEAVVQEFMSLESFATLQYARIDSEACRMDFVDCGHTPILHYDSTLGLCWAVKGVDLPLGFVSEATYSCFSLPLSPGDRLVFHSDGLTEAANAAGDLFGEKRLADIIAANATAEPKELVRRILNTVMFFASGQGFGDDVTCVAVSVDRSPSPPRRAAEDFPSALAQLSEIRAFLERTLGGEDETLAARVILTACELVSNAIRHGNEGEKAEVAAKGEATVDRQAEELEEFSAAEERPAVYPTPGPRSLRLECIRSDRWVAVRLIHHGISFPWYRLGEQPSIEGLPSGGLGLLLIQKAADSIFYATGPGNLSLACAVFARSDDAGPHAE
jgi:serine phosphatase RsbU (regulator of sigma subunit)/anti-sigma regulatory factor (Ser/Thr protein kinase)